MLSSDYVRISVACSNHHFPAQQSLCDEYRTVIRDALPWDFQLEYSNKNNFFFSLAPSHIAELPQGFKDTGRRKVIPHSANIASLPYLTGFLCKQLGFPFACKSRLLLSPILFSNKRKHLLFSKNN